MWSRIGLEDVFNDYQPEERITLVGDMNGYWEMKPILLREPVGHSRKNDNGHACQCLHQEESVYFQYIDEV